MTDTPIDIRRADERFATDLGWLDSKHSFSFGHHYDPTNTGHGQLIVLNDDRVVGGGGFATHSHRDMEIVTWVLSGELEHRDSEGNHGIIHPGLAQRMSAGRGIRHSEMNASATEEVHFIQMWVVPDTASIDPGYEQLDVSSSLDGGGLVPIASGQGHDGAVSIHQRDAVLWGGRLGADEPVTVPAAPLAHLFVAVGGGDLETAGALGPGDAARLTDAGALGPGDAARLTDAGALGFRAGPEGAEVLLWTTGRG